MDDERFVEAWVQTALAVAARYGPRAGADQLSEAPA
jgi:hypothetical protein